MKYACAKAKEDIDLFFSLPAKGPAGQAPLGRALKHQSPLERAIEHMTRGSTAGCHNVSCEECWEYYTRMKRKYCGR